MKKIASWILIITGVLIIGIAIYQEISTFYFQKKMIEEYNMYVNTLKSMEVSEISSETMKAEQEYDSGTETKNPDILIQETVNDESDNKEEQVTKNESADNEKIKSDYEKFFENKVISGLVEIPRLKVSAAILEGTDDSALKYAIGHYPGLGKIGEQGNYVLLGHRNYVYGHFFRNLDKLKVGDEVIIQKDTETYTYVVYESFVVSPEEVWVLEQTQDAIITLITCTPVGTYTDRLIVRGALKPQGV
ncbi:MAG: hypothetical protein K0R07_1544 [Sedimentibacter sp.]|nr:hypothetical protein [Sedimentibacter sp.]